LAQETSVSANPIGYQRNRHISTQIGEISRIGQKLNRYSLYATVEQSNLGKAVVNEMLGFLLRSLT
jgi:hypothetical protein